MRRLFLMLILLLVPVAARAQDVPAVPSASAPVPSTAPAAGAQATGSGAPTIVSPQLAPAQPIAFNHKQHVNVAKLGCNDCHAPSKNGATVAMPQPAKCMICHAAVASDKPDIQRLAAAAKNNEPIAWVRVYNVPSFVTFSHKTHMDSGSQCEDCHGPVAQRETIALEKDISMGGCVSCHTAKAAPVGCATCHELQSQNKRLMDADSVMLARLGINAVHPGPKKILSVHSYLRDLLTLAAGVTEFLSTPPL